VFVAMAFIDGETLRQWQTRTQRPWQDVVAMYRRIGEGLAFAHDEKIIHRDFKPDNVLIDEDGRPHITDFGLAKIVLAEGPLPTDDRDSARTIRGTIAGTPGYMSPQQQTGEATDERTDQYAFCVSLFEALHGALPTAEPPVADVPKRVLAAIQRGLVEEPDQRWPSMHALLAELAPQAPTQRKLAVAAAVVLAAGFAVWLALPSSEPADVCDAPQARQMWLPVRAEVMTAFASQGVQADELVTAFDVWTTQWSDMARASCRASANGSQSGQLLDLRARCLDHALDVATDLVQLASHADRALAHRESSIAANLPKLEPCADMVSLLGMQPWPTDPVRRSVIGDLYKRLGNAEALYKTESYGAANEQLQALEGPVRAIGYGPLTFEVYAWRAALEVTRGTDAAAAASAEWAAIAADPTRHDALIAEAWINLVWIVGVLQHEPAQALELARVAEANAKLVDDRHWLALLDYRVGVLLGEIGKHDEAIARLERAHTSLDALKDVYNEIAALQGEGVVYGAKGDTVGRLKVFEEALALAEHLPHGQLILANQLNAVAIAYTDDGRCKDARALLQRALAVLGDGKDDPGLLAATHANLGNCSEREGDFAAAEQSFRAEVDVASAALGPNTSDVAHAWYNLGEILCRRGEFAQAIESLRNVELLLRRIPPEAASDPDYVGPGLVARQLVAAHLGLNHTADAVAAAENNVAFAQQIKAPPEAVGHAHFALATAAWAAGDRARARAAMRLAAAEFRAAHTVTDDADEWLASHL
jgi:tetratricopeptide (TPR) repeat protein